MENFNLIVPATPLNVTSRDVTVTIDVAAIPHDVLRQVMWHGIKQKVADAASAAASLVYFDVKGKDAPKPSRDQLAAFSEANDKAIKDQTLALMQKAVDALLAGRWAVREASGTVSKWTEEQALAIDLAKAELVSRFTDALAKVSPGTKPTASAFVGLSDKTAKFFKPNEKRPTWDDAMVLEYAKTRLASAKPRDFMAEAREELARREAANAAMDDVGLDDLLGDL